VNASRGPQKTSSSSSPDSGTTGSSTTSGSQTTCCETRSPTAARSEVEPGGREEADVVRGDYTNLTNVGSQIFQLQQIAGEVRHAEQGYSGWVASITIDQDRLNQLYDNDYDL